MATVPLIQYEDATDEVKAIYDKIKAARGLDDVNNFWKATAHQPALAETIFDTIHRVMAPGELDPLTKELIYVAVSIANNCDYCIHAHTASARKKGMSDAQYGEFLEVVAIASQANAVANGMKIPVDDQFIR